MDPAEYSWSDRNNLAASSLDLLEEEVLREGSKYDPHWKRKDQLLVEGEPAATFPREVSRISPRKPQIVPKTIIRRRSKSKKHGDRNTNNAEEEEGLKKQLQIENERLQHEIRQWQREVEHTREEKLELEASFRRLDKEIGNGYHLAERKEKELRIAELVTKNQKMSQLLEKELQGHGELRRIHTELQGEHRKSTEQVDLLNRVLDSVESKHAELSSSHSTLTASYEAAQTTIETLQSEILTLQDKLATSATHVQIVTEYEDKIQQWERSCHELEQKCEHKTQKLTQTQKIATAAQHEAQCALDRQEELEQELRNAHDQIIRTNAAIRTMEAKLEANLQAYGSQNSLHHRISQLEGELLQKNQVNAELMQTCNQLLGSQKRPSSGRASLSARTSAVTSQVGKLSSRITSLTDKLCATEEARDRKTRSLDILMQAFPFLLQRLNAMQDQLAAAVESNDILTCALEQINAGSDCNNPASICNKPRVSGSMYLHLAREKYLLEAPYPIELLADQTGAQVLSGNPDITTTFSRKATKFTPFRVKCSALQPKHNQSEVDSDDQMHQLVMLSADSNDTSGASYLNRSKLNAFLEVIQTSTARKKFKTLVIGKLAECLNKLRLLAHRSASEAATQQATIQMLQREVVELQYKLKNTHNSNDYHHDEVKATKDAYKTRQFLLKIIDVYAEKQQENEHFQKTFLTQPLSSDMLITNAHINQNESSNVSEDRLCLSDCGIEDDEVGQLLVKIMVSGVKLREIDLALNKISDLGAQHVADFVAKTSSVHVVSLIGNKYITRRGIDFIRGGLLKNQRVQRISEDKHGIEDGIVLRGLAIQQDFDVSGIATEMLRIILPNGCEKEEIPGEYKTTTPEAIDAVTEKLRQLGFRYNIRKAPASARPRSANYHNRTRAVGQLSEQNPRTSTLPNTSRRPQSAGSTFNRKAPIPTSSGATRRKSLPSSGISDFARRQQIKQQQDLRFQSLEAAIQRASAPRQRLQTNRSSYAQFNSRVPFSRGDTGNSNRKRYFGNTHVNTIRGLRR